MSDRGPRAVFVGRHELLDTLVVAIRQTERRGTVLVSGYRGSGKTTLLIESIRRASELLPPPWRLVPIVLNASEVSASLGPSPGGPTPKIGPQQLLTALIRALRNYADSPNARLDPALAADIRDVYRKAIAKEYTRSEGVQRQRSRTLTRDFELKLTAANAYKGLSAAGAVAAVLLEGSAWFSSWRTALHGVAAAVGALAVASWTASRKFSEVAKQESSEAVSVKFDNSLQQLENDLKELVTRLHTAKLRTIVVLEELDKIRDDDGQQLDAVISYFKNLFTQAPALFFFVTDKSYYDFISGELRRGRRERTYALQHTFFTHRLFVGRPTTHDCIDYFKSIVTDPAALKSLGALYAPNGLPPFSEQLEADPLLRLVRYLLFKACNHFFDLKNELRRFIRPDGNAFVLEPSLLGDDEASLGTLQDLVFETTRLFAIGDGRSYGNEVLNDCLYAVFNDVGSGQPQHTASFYPRTIHPNSSEDPAAKASAPGQSPALSAPSGQPAATGNQAPAPKPEGSPAVSREDQLDLAEEVRIKDAVDSLIEDLQRGGAFDSEQTNITEGYFVWKAAATRAFRFVRHPRRHEAALLARIDRLRAATALLKTGGTLAHEVGVTQAADVLARDLEARVGELEKAASASLVDQTEREIIDWQRRAEGPIGTAYQAHLTRATNRYGFQFVQAGQSAEASKLFMLKTPLGDPRDRAVQSGGAVIIAQGEGGRLTDDVREFVARSPALQRLAIIHVLFAPDESATETVQVEHWRHELIGEMRRPLANGAPRVLAVDVLALDEDRAAETIAEGWGDTLVERLLLRANWAALALTTDWAAADLTGLTVVTDGRSEPKAFIDAVQGWLKGSQRVLHMAADTTSAARLIAASVEVMRSVHIENVIALPMSGVDPKAVLIQQMFRVAGGEEKDERRARARVVSLMNQRAVIPIIDGTSDVSVPQLFVDDLSDGGRAIVVAPDSWAPLSIDGPMSTLKVRAQANASTIATL